MSGLARLLAQLVALSCRRARSIVAAAVLISLLAAAYTATHFSVHTEVAALIPADEPWRAQERALEAAFAQQGDDITIVIDGKTPELADDAAARLTAALAARKDLFRHVERPGEGPFFQREGVLYLPEAEVRATTEALVKAQPLLAPVGADASLRGVLTAMTTGADAVASGQATPDQLAGPLAAIADTAEAVEHGRPAFFSWRPLITGRPVDSSDKRQFVELIPKLDYGQTDPGREGIAVVRAAAQRLGLDAAHGVRLRLTGEVPMEADELVTLNESTGPIGIATLALVLAVLYLALRSPKIVFSIVATVLVGLAITAAFGLVVYHRFNLISVAFLPLFVGLGIDFAIQFCVRYRAESIAEPDTARALAKAGAGAGQGLTLAAAATGLGFLAFLPTRYKGVSELGLIAGVGMAVAFLLAVTFLPALLKLTGARSPAEEAGLPALRNADRPVQAYRGWILFGAALLGFLSLLVSPRLGFNFDPLSLRNPRTESVATFLELARDPDTAPDNLDVLSPNVAAASATAARLAVLPQVRRVLTVESLVPPDQAPKLALVADAALLLDPTVNPFDVAALPTDADLVASLGGAVRALRALAETPSGVPVRAQALRLAHLLQAAQDGPPQGRARLQAALVAGLPDALDQVRSLLSAAPITLDSLPPEIKADWLTPDGRARVQISPVAPSGDRNGLRHFVQAVQRVTPGAVGPPVAVAQTRRLMLDAFGQAAMLSLIAITALLSLALRSVRAVLLTLTAVLLSALLTLGACVLFRQDINLENLIALPLLLGIGVSFNIYFVVAWRGGETALLRSSLTRAVLYSALTTGVAFGALSLSQHPGTASLGVLLLISLTATLAVTLVVLPALLGVAAKTLSASSTSAR